MNNSVLLHENFNLKIVIINLHVHIVYDDWISFKSQPNFHRNEWKMTYYICNKWLASAAFRYFVKKKRNVDLDNLKRFHVCFSSSSTSISSRIIEDLLIWTKYWKEKNCYVNDFEWQIKCHANNIIKNFYLWNYYKKSTYNIINVKFNTSRIWISNNAFMKKDHIDRTNQLN